MLKRFTPFIVSLLLLTIGGMSTSYAGFYMVTGAAFEPAPILSPGENCDEAVAVIEGSYTAPNPDYWYSFTIPTSGSYIISTCDLAS